MNGSELEVKKRKKNQVRSGFKAKVDFFTFLRMICKNANFEIVKNL